jgi:RimJ/RimL family protein N-acetyltransferase
VRPIRSLDRIETARLVAKRPTSHHEADLKALLADERVAGTLFPGGAPPTPTEVIANRRAKEAHWTRYGFGLWMLYDRLTGEFVGRGGLQHTLATGEDEIEIGWAIVPERWGEGLATELALKSVQAGFETLGLSELIAYTLTDNLASRRVMEKAGLTFERDIEHAGMPHVLYRLARC